jgi:FkbM family methyltransferase
MAESVKIIKKIAKATLPPVIHEMARRLIYPYKYTPHPAWYRIKNGMLQGREIFADPRNGLWPRDMVEGSHDIFFFQYVETMDRRKKVFFDVGAHIGFSAMNFAQLAGNECEVYAFEPNTFNLERMNIILSKNPDLAGRIRVVGVAVSDTEGESDFYFSGDVDGGMSSGSFIAKPQHVHLHGKDYLDFFEKTTVKTVSLDHFSSTNGAGIIPDVIKIDVEGNESAVLQGATQILKRYRPVLLIEIHSIFNMLKTYEILRSVNYHVVLLKEDADGRCFIAGEPKTGVFA